MTLFVGSQSFISLPSSMPVSAPVSEIRELNQNKKKKKNFKIGYFQFDNFLKKKNSEIGYFQFDNFPGHIIYPFFKPELPFKHKKKKKNFKIGYFQFDNFLKKKNSEIGYFQFDNFPGHIIYPFF